MTAGNADSLFEAAAAVRSQQKQDGNYVGCMEEQRLEKRIYFR